MSPRSLLFVPGDRPERFAKAVTSGADAVILDLEDSVLPERKQAARAEDPAKGFLPSTGRLKYFQLPSLYRRRYRNDAGVEQGDEICPFYDPMIAKLITHAETREAAIANLREMTAITCCWPVKCNAGFLNLALWDEDFEAGLMDTGLIAREGEDLIPYESPSYDALQSVALMVIDEALGGKPLHIRDTYLDRDKGPWSKLGFRLNGNRLKPIIRLRADGRDYEFPFDEIAMDDSLWVRRVNEGYLVTDEGMTHVLSAGRTDGSQDNGGGSGVILAPMPGKVIALDVAEGQEVAQGERLMVLEAMKMEHALIAPFAGRVAELSARLGAQVEVEALLARIEKGEGE